MTTGVNTFLRSNVDNICDYIWSSVSELPDVISEIKSTSKECLTDKKIAEAILHLKYTVTNNFCNFLIKADNVCDYIPHVSTVSNLFCIVLKTVNALRKRYTGNGEFIKAGPFYRHLDEKHIIRCAVLLIPVVGNLAVAIFDLFESGHKDLDELNKIAKVWLDVPSNWQGDSYHKACHEMDSFFLSAHLKMGAAWAIFLSSAAYSIFCCGPRR